MVDYVSLCIYYAAFIKTCILTQKLKVAIKKRDTRRKTINVSSVEHVSPVRTPSVEADTPSLLFGTLEKPSWM